MPQHEDTPPLDTFAAAGLAAAAGSFYSTGYAEKRFWHTVSTIAIFPEFKHETQAET